SGVTFMSGARWVVVSVVLLVLGCAPGPSVVRSGDLILLASGDPRTPCERASFLELVPSHGEATSERATLLGNRMRFEEGKAKADGLAVYRPTEQSPVLLPSLLSSPAFEDVRARHLKLTQPILDQKFKSQMFALGGLGGIGASLGVLYLAVNEQSMPGTTNVPLLITSAALFIAGTVVGFTGVGMRPGTAREAELLLRDRMFIAPDDDPEAVRKAVAAQNEQARQQCESPAPAR
ncbi:MAG TPA: hypothetical protein VND93_26640, partial [Myxococcales bacterium]|nr:hypothetical protein [Myxococcales bacterium]